MEVWRWVNTLTHPEDEPRWKKGQPLAGKTKAHVRAAMRTVFEFAMLAELFPLQRNPIDLVKVTGATKKTRKNRVLTYAEWERFIAKVVAEPQRTAVITTMCLGIRREEVWALKWGDFDFAANTVMIQRAIVGGKVLSVKTAASEAPLPLDESLVELLLDWRGKSPFNADTDWVWASPYSGGEMPLYVPAIQRDYIIPASVAAGLGKIGWHCFRHTYRSWMNAQGTPLGIQKDLMRHSSISMTTQYGAGVVDAMREANSKVVRQVIQ
jgi:integrase